MSNFKKQQIEKKPTVSVLGISLSRDKQLIQEIPVQANPLQDISLQELSQSLHIPKIITKESELSKTLPKPSSTTELGSFKPAIRLSRTMSNSQWSPSRVDILRKHSVSSQMQSPCSSTKSSFGIEFTVPSTAASYLSQFNHVQEHDEEFQVGDVIGDYTLVREIGVGAYSKVYEAVTVVKPEFIIEKRESYSLAVKITNSTSQKRISRESLIWSRLQHPYILSLVELFQLDDSCILVSEMADCSLLDHIRVKGSPGLIETEAKLIFKQITNALEYLHEEMGIIHHDLKLENILLQDGHVKIGDFGMAEEMVRAYQGQGGEIVGEDPNRHKDDCMGICCSGIEKEMVMESVVLEEQHCGSVHYLSPEVLVPQPHGLKMASPSGDLWALGCILYAMLTGSLPFNDTFLPRLQMYIVNGKYDVEKLDRYRVSAEAKEVVGGLLKVDVKERWDIQRVAGCLFLK